MIESWNGPMEERLMWKVEFGSSLHALHAFNVLGGGGYLLTMLRPHVEGVRERESVPFSHGRERERSAAFLHEEGPLLTFLLGKGLA